MMDQPKQPDPPKGLVRQKWYLRWWGVTMLLAAVGPFAFPALWKSKDFNPASKWFLTLLFTALTIALTWASWKTVEIFLEHFRILQEIYL
jgi:hypothetical protein